MPPTGQSLLVDAAGDSRIATPTASQRSRSSPITDRLPDRHPLPRGPWACLSGLPNCRFSLHRPRRGCSRRRRRPCSPMTTADGEACRRQARLHDSDHGIKAQSRCAAGAVPRAANPLLPDFKLQETEGQEGPGLKTRSGARITFDSFAVIAGDPGGIREGSDARPTRSARSISTSCRIMAPRLRDRPRSSTRCVRALPS